MEPASGGQWRRSQGLKMQAKLVGINYKINDNVWLMLVMHGLKRFHATTR